MEEYLLNFIAPIISALIAAFIAVYNYRKQSWCDNVSKERMKWMNEFRNEVGKIIKAIKLFEQCEYLSSLEFKNDENNNFEHKECEINEHLQTILEGEEAKYKLLTRINTNSVKGNEFNFEYKKMLNNLIFSKDKIKEFDVDAFMKLTNIILEFEWEKVKKEARGKI